MRKSRRARLNPKISSSIFVKSLKTYSNARDATIDYIVIANFEQETPGRMTRSEVK